MIFSETSPGTGLKENIREMMKENLKEITVCLKVRR